MAVGIDTNKAFKLRKDFIWFSSFVDNEILLIFLYELGFSKSK